MESVCLERSETQLQRTGVSRATATATVRRPKASANRTTATASAPTTQRGQLAPPVAGAFTGTPETGAPASGDVPPELFCPVWALDPSELQTQDLSMSVSGYVPFYVCFECF